MVVALADSFFFDVDPNAARSKVLGFLLISFAPFLVVAPLIGPLIDRIRGGRRFIVQLAAASRILLQILMIGVVDDWALFPLVFAALVVQKTYTVSKSALVPSVVRNEVELVEANSKLGVIAGVTGFVAVVPAALLQVLLGSGVTLAYGAIIFGVALGAATRLPRETVPTRVTGDEALELTGSALQLGASAMLLLRACVGFVLFHLAFWLGTEDAGKVWFALAVGLASLGTMAGNTIGPALRRAAHEERMLILALGLPAVAGIVGAVLGGRAAGVALAVVVNFSAAIGRLAFESIVQRDAPRASRGQAFARFETRFQLGWVAAATVPVLIDIPGALGILLVGVATLTALVYSLGPARREIGRRRRAGSSRRDGRITRP